MPARGDHDPEQTALMVLPAGKIWSPETYITASVVRELTVPDGRLIVLPNNNTDQTAYTFTKDEAKTVASGDLSPLSERQVRLCENLGIDALALVVGHSFGAAAGASFGKATRGVVELRANAYDEPPNTYPSGSRAAVALRKAMMRENGFVKPTIRDNGIPAFGEIVGIDRPVKFALGLARYAVGSNVLAPNRAINTAFLSDSFYDDVSGMLTNNPNASFVVANATSSTVGSNKAVQDFIETATQFVRHSEGTAAEHLMYDG